MPSMQERMLAPLTTPLLRGKMNPEMKKGNVGHINELRVVPGLVNKRHQIAPGIGKYSQNPYPLYSAGHPFQPLRTSPDTSGCLMSPVRYYAVIRSLLVGHTSERP